jgi:uncharacterized coiled-coil DUF342 family protein
MRVYASSNTTCAVRRVDSVPPSRYAGAVADSPNSEQGIRLVLEEIRELRRESTSMLKEMRQERAEDRRQAAEDRRQAAEDRRRSDALFARHADRAEEDRKGIRDALVAIGNVGRKFQSTLTEHSRLLKEIRDAIRRQGNGRSGGNGHP